MSICWSSLTTLEPGRSGNGVKRQAGQTPRYREHTFYQGQTGELLVQKLQPLAFSLDEEPSIAEVTERLSKGLNVDRVTKRFFDRFKSEHKAFLKLVNGIPVKGDREWYASLMLNRLMFVYFVQRKRFLDNDPEYLLSRLTETKRRLGPDHFFHLLPPLSAPILPRGAWAASPRPCARP